MSIRQLNITYLMSAAVAHKCRDSDSKELLGVSDQLAAVIAGASGAEINRVIHPEFTLFKPILKGLNQKVVGGVGRRKVMGPLQGFGTAFLLAWKEENMRCPATARLRFGLSNQDAEVLEKASIADLSFLAHPDTITFRPRLSSANFEKHLRSHSCSYDIEAARLAINLVGG